MQPTFQAIFVQIITVVGSYVGAINWRTDLLPPVHYIASPAPGDFVLQNQKARTHNREQSGHHTIAERRIFFEKIDKSIFCNLY